MYIFPLKITDTAVSGTISYTTIKLVCSIIREILVKPTTTSTTCDIKIVNSDSLIIFETTAITGELAEVVELPVRGIYTVVISNSSVDELFNIQLVIEE